MCHPIQRIGRVVARIMGAPVEAASGVSVTRKGEVLTLAVIGAVAAFGAVSSRYPKATPFDPEFDQAARDHQLDSDLLRAIAHQETGGTFNPNAIGPRNTNGTRDYGLMQINDVTARALGISATELLGNPKLSINKASELLVMLKRELGPLWSPWTWVAAYNAGAPAIRQRGIFNMAYASSVMFHWQMYKLRRGVA